MEERFFDEAKDLDQSKIKTYKDTIKSKRDEIYQLSYNERRKRKRQSKAKSKKGALKDVANYDLLLGLVKKLSDDTSASQTHDDLNNLLSIEASLKVEGNLLGYQEVGEGIRGFLKKYSIKLNSTPLGEAKNLVVQGKERLFYEQGELTNLKSKKLDISKLEPPTNSQFVFFPEDISKVDVNKSYFEGKNPLYKDMNVWWPKTNVFKLKKIRKTQSKPKLDVYYNNPVTGKKEIFKIKLAEEIHSEGTVAALANTIGIYTDLSKNLRDIKIYLGDMSYNDFRNDWYSYFDGFDLDRLIKERASDENGEYLLFYDGLIEQKFKSEDTYKRLGPWAWGENDHKHLRETRGLFLFSVWIGNTDLKESENNKLIVRTNAKKARTFKVMHDIGFSLGNLLSEKPLNYKWNPIKKVTDEEIVFNFFNIQDNSGYEHVTMADARWMIRRIAQLTRKQIADAVTIGGWPDKEPYNIHRLLIEKLISRRNHFVKTFGLLGDVLPNGKVIELLDFKKKDIKKVPEYIGDYTVDFSTELSDLTRDPLKQIPHFILNLMKMGISAIQKVEIDPIEIGLDSGFISQIIFSVKRDIVRNPSPAHEDETFIVKDTFLVGARLGYGYVLSGDVAKYREYTLIQTAKTEHDAKYINKFFLNLLLPFQVMIKNLPKKHILTISDFIETRGRVKLATPGSIFVGLGTEGTVSRLGLGRTIISKDDQSNIVFYDDKADFNQLAWRTFVNIGVVKIPFHHVDIKKGKLNREIYKLSLDDFKKYETRQAVQRAIENQDHSQIKKLALPQKISSDFVEKNFKANFLGFVGRTSYQRQDLITDLGISESDEDDRYIYKLERSNESFWNSFLSTEAFFEFSQIVTEKDRDGNVVDSVLKLSYLHDDKRVKSKELQGTYLNFLNAVGKQKDAIKFTPSEHSSNNEWGHLNVRLSLDLYKTGLEKIAALKLSDLMKTASKVTGKSYRELVNIYKKFGNSRSSRDYSLNKNLRFKFRGKKYYFQKYFREIKAFAIHLKNIREGSKSEELISKSLLNAFYKVVKRDKGSFSPLILHTVIESISKEDYYLETSFYPNSGIENKLPERLIPFNSEGKKKENKTFDFLTHMEDTLNVFIHFSKI